MILSEIGVVVVVVTKRQLDLVRLLRRLRRPLLVYILRLDFLWDSLAPKRQLVVDGR